MLTTEINNHIVYNYKLYLKKTHSTRNMQPWYNSACSFIKYLNNMEILYNTINKSVIGQYVDYLKDKEKSIKYINNLIVGLRIFYKYLYENKFISRSKYNECYLVKMISKDLIQIGEIITIEELDELIKNMTQYFYWSMQNPYKLKSILYFMFYTGIVRQEIVKLKRDNIDLTRCLVNIVETQTYLPRIVYFPEIVKELLIKYFKSEKEIFNVFNMTYRQLGSIGNYLRRYKISGKTFTFTLLRRSFIKMLIKNNIDILTIQKLAGIKGINYLYPYFKSHKIDTETLYKEHIKHNGKRGK